MLEPVMRGDERSLRVNVDVRGVPSTVVPLEGLDFVVEDYNVTGLGFTVSSVDVLADDFYLVDHDGDAMISFTLCGLTTRDKVERFCRDRLVDDFKASSGLVALYSGDDYIYLEEGKDGFIASVNGNDGFGPIPNSLHHVRGPKNMWMDIIRLSSGRFKSAVATKIANVYGSIGLAADADPADIACRCGISEETAKAFVNWFSLMWTDRIIVSSAEGVAGLLFFKRSGIK